MNKKYLTNAQTARFFRGLSLLVHAGITVGDGLFYLAEQNSDGLGPLMTELGKGMDNGISLSAAMEQTKLFSAHAVGLVAVGERTGHIEEALGSLGEYYQQRERTDRQIKNAVVYPSTLLLLILAVIAVLLIKVLPVFDSVYTSLGSRLTGLAGVLLVLGQAAEKILPLLCAFMAAAAIMLLIFSESENFRQRVVNKFKNSLGPKSVFKKLNDAHFAEALAMGLSSGISDEESAELAAALLRDDAAASAKCNECVGLLSQGCTLPQALLKTASLPASECRMLELGIRAGNGDKVMSEIAQRLYEQAENSLQHRIGQIEPIMVMTASLLVGAILLSVMLPLMNIMSAIG